MSWNIYAKYVMKMLHTKKKIEKSINYLKWDNSVKFFLEKGSLF